MTIGNQAQFFVPTFHKTVLKKKIVESESETSLATVMSVEIICGLLSRMNVSSSCKKWNLATW